jgi:hypothetical protein
MVKNTAKPLAEKIKRLINQSLQNILPGSVFLFWAVIAKPFRWERIPGALFFAVQS